MKPIKIAIAFFLIAFSMSIYASAVERDIFSSHTMYSGAGSDLNVYYYNIVSPELGVTYNRNARGNISSITSKGYTNAGDSAAKWIIANAGDVLTANYFDVVTESFADYWFSGDTSIYGNQAISVSQGETIYAALVGRTSVPEEIGSEYYYAWVELSVATTGLTLEHSAFMTSEGLVVGGGAVPEPTSALLLLLGVAGIALRRKQA